MLTDPSGARVVTLEAPRWGFRRQNARRRLSGDIAVWAEGEREAWLCLWDGQPLHPIRMQAHLDALEPADELALEPA
jgi:hypothetical protein